MAPALYHRDHLPATLAAWADCSADDHSLRSISHSTTHTHGSSHAAHAPRAAWLLDVGHALARLDDRSRRLLLLAYACGRTDQQLADRLGCTRQTILRHRHAALDTLARLLAG